HEGCQPNRLVSGRDDDWCEHCHCAVDGGLECEVSDEERDEWFARCTRDRHAGEHVVDEEIGEARAKGHCDLYRHVYARVAITANVRNDSRRPHRERVLAGVEQRLPPAPAATAVAYQ